MKGTLMAKKKQLPEEVAHSEAYTKEGVCRSRRSMRPYRIIKNN